MDPLSAIAVWLSRMAEAELRYLATAVPLWLRNAWLEMELICIDMRILWRTKLKPARKHGPNGFDPK